MARRKQSEMGSENMIRRIKRLMDAAILESETEFSAKEIAQVGVDAVEREGGGIYKDALVMELCLGLAEKEIKKQKALKLSSTQIELWSDCAKDIVISVKDGVYVRLFKATAKMVRQYLKRQLDDIENKKTAHAETERKLNPFLDWVERQPDSHAVMVEDFLFAGMGKVSALSVRPSPGHQPPAPP